ncbi:hypothetical protein GCM10020218_005160 [Dactylosporangium vinaceum]
MPPPLMQRPQQHPDDHDEHRHPEHDHEPERHRHPQQQRGHHDDRHDRPAGPGGDVDGVPDVVEVGGPDAHHFPGRHPLLQRRPEPGCLPRRDLHGPEPGAEKVRDREPMPHDPRERRGGPEPEDRRPGPEQPAAIVPRERIHPAPDGRRDERLTDHPQHAERHTTGDEPQLPPHDPDQIPKRRPAVRLPGLILRQSSHSPRR